MDDISEDVARTMQLGSGCIDFDALRAPQLEKRRGDTSELCWLTDKHMAKLVPLFPKSHGRSGADDKRALSGIIFRP